VSNFSLIWVGAVLENMNPTIEQLKIGFYQFGLCRTWLCKKLNMFCWFHLYH